MNVPPRSGKSSLASIAFAAWVMGHDPTKRLICVSYSEELARKFSLDTRRVVESPWYRELFPDFELVPHRQRDIKLTTTNQGSRFAAGVGGAVLGQGADLIIIDDPIKALDALSENERRRVAEFYDNTLITRLNDKKTGAIVIVMQRLHQDDLVGHVLKRDEWEHISLPAIAREETVHRLRDNPLRVHRRRPGDVLHRDREPIEVLEAVKRAQGSRTFQAQYQQDPVPAGGNMIRRDWLRYYDEKPSRFDRVIASWDTASTLDDRSDWSVGMIWGAIGLDYYLLHVHRDRLKVPDLRRAIVDLTARWKADPTLIEKTELGRAIAQDLASTGVLRPVLRPPRFDKRARLEAQSARFETGQVYLPREAPWLGEYERELLAFPSGQHDDQVDATSQALNWFTDRAAFDRPLVRRNIRRRRSSARRSTAAAGTTGADSDE
jgi:predicted phage terminase large subunit-like protein